MIDLEQLQKNATNAFKAVNKMHIDFEVLTSKINTFELTPEQRIEVDGLIKKVNEEKQKLKDAGINQ
jgi:archaellum component FlaC